MKKIIWTDNKKNIPLGNGRLGALIDSTEDGKETIRLFEESLWSGAWNDRTNSSAHYSTKKIQELLKLNRTQEAEQLLRESWGGTTEEARKTSQGPVISINFYDSENYGSTDFNYKNVSSSITELDLENATYTKSISYESVLSTADFSQKSNGTSIQTKREAFISTEDDVLIYHISASVPKSIFLSAKICLEDATKKYSLGDDTIVLQDTKGIPFSTVVTAVSSSGSVIVRGDNLIVENADDVTLYIDLETAYKLGHYKRKMGLVHRKGLLYASRCSDVALKKICLALSLSYSSSKIYHQKEFSELFNRVALETKTETDFNFNFYKLLSSQRHPGYLPALKDGLWSDEKRFNLSPRNNDLVLFKLCDEKLNLPYLNLLKTGYKNAKKTSTKMYSSSGYVFHNETDLWGDSIPSGTDISSFKPFGAYNFAKFIIDWYEYTLDKKFLKKNFKYVHNAAEFFEYYLSKISSENLALCPAFEDSLKYSSAENNMLVKKFFELASKAYIYLYKKTDNENILRYKSIIQKLNCEDFETPETESLESKLSAQINKIVTSSMDEKQVTIHLLLDAKEPPVDGCLTNLKLKGNIYINLKWENGNILEAKIHAVPGTNYAKIFSVEYKEKNYPFIMEKESMDLLNILPSTVTPEND